MTLAELVKWFSENSELSMIQLNRNVVLKPKYDAFQYSHKALIANLQRQAYTGIDRVFNEVINGANRDA